MTTPVAWLASRRPFTRIAIKGSLAIVAGLLGPALVLGMLLVTSPHQPVGKPDLPPWLMEWVASHE